jgi:isoleucyl-tRNA synthetase
MPESIHLADWPEVEEARRDFELERRMDITQQAVSMGRAIRSLHNLKTRQPLRAIYLVTRQPEEKRILLEMEDIIREELNVKEVIFRDNEEELVEYSAKANFKVLGAKLGKDMKAAADKIALLKGREIVGLMEGATLSLDIGERSVDITIESVLVQRAEKQGLKVLNEGSLTVGLDPVVTEELRQEGLARDFVRGVQNLRKESGLEISDRIRLEVQVDAGLQAAIEAFEDFIKNETLCEKLVFSSAALPTAFESGEVAGTVRLAKL